MYAQSSSARRNREVNSANDVGLALVEAARDQGKVALRVEALSKRFGSIEALADVSFDVRRGEAFGLLGLNGAGKTTLISMLATERRPSAELGKKSPILSSRTNDLPAAKPCAATIHA